MYLYVLCIFISNIYIWYLKKKNKKVSQRKSDLTVVTVVRNTTSAMIAHFNDTMCFQIASCALSMFSPFLLQGCVFIRSGYPSEIKDWCGWSSYSKVT